MPKRKRRPTKKQLRALAKGRAKLRAIRKRKRRTVTRRKPIKRRVIIKKTPIKRRVMAKRRRVGAGDTLTGGSKDVNPQYMHGQIVLSAGDTLSSASYNVPIVRMPQSGRVTIMEILKIFFMPSPWALSIAAQAKQIQKINFSTISQGTTTYATFEEPNVFCEFETYFSSSFTALGTGYGFSPSYPLVWDFTDGAGHGFLVASDRIFVQADTDAMVNVATLRFKVLYRFKTVSLQEYVGIVQSQQ